MTTEVQAMTDDEARTLGERWVKAGGGWRPGMLVGATTDRIVSVYTDESPTRILAYDGFSTMGSEQIAPDAWPDPRDPATLGTWLATVRERYGDPTAHTRYSHEWSRWYVYIKGDALPGGHLTEAEALVAALEAAP